MVLRFFGWIHKGARPLFHIWLPLYMAFCWKWTTGSVRARFCPTGNRMFPALDRDLKFGFQANGSLVVARGKQDDTILKVLASVCLMDRCGDLL